MAYGLRLRFEHHDFNGALTRIDIKERDYTGIADVRTLDGNEPFTINYGSKSGKKLPCVYGSEGVIKFIADFDLEYLYLFTSDSKKYLVEHYFESSLFWAGFIAPEKWSEPLTAPPYLVEATATDGLGALKDITVPEFIEGGRKTLLEIIHICLSKTGLTINLNTAVNWQETTQAVGTDPLAIHTIDTIIFKDLKAYEILEQVLTGCRVFQRLGQWWIISNTNLVNDTISYKNYTYPSFTTATTGTINIKASGYWIQDEPTLEILPAIKQLTLIQDFGYNDNLIKNGDFKKYQRELNQFIGWENLYVTPTQQKLDKDGNVYVMLPGRQYIPYFDTHGYGHQHIRIRKTFSVRATESIVKFALKYAAVGVSGTPFMFIMIRIVGTTTTYYLQRTQYVEKVEEFNWADLAAIPVLGDDRISLGNHLKKSKTRSYFENGNEKPYYYNSSDTVTAYPLDQVQDHFESFIASIPGIPEDGIFEIYLYLPYTTSFTVEGSAFTGVEIQMLDETEEEYPTQTTVLATDDINNNFVPETETLLIGDYPNIANSAMIYSGGLARADKSHTSGWTTSGGSTYYPFIEFQARTAAAQQNVPRQNYQIRLADMVPGLNLVIDDVTVTGRRLIETGISYDNRMQAIEGQYTEVLAINLNAPSVEVNTEIAESGGSGNSGSSGNTVSASPLNADERVSVMSAEGAKVSAPAFMDDEYFEAVQDAVTGYSRIKLKRIPITIPFANTATPSIENYNIDYAEIYGQNPRLSVVVVDADGNQWERHIDNIRHLTAGLITRITWDLAETYTGYINLS